jgi:hypothetical protein
MAQTTGGVYVRDDEVQQQLLHTNGVAAVFSIQFQPGTEKYISKPVEQIQHSFLVQSVVGAGSAL